MERKIEEIPFRLGPGKSLRINDIWCNFFPANSVYGRAVDDHGPWKYETTEWILKENRVIFTKIPDFGSDVKSIIFYDRLMKLFGPQVLNEDYHEPILTEDEVRTRLLQLAEWAEAVKKMSDAETIEYRNRVIYGR